MTITKEDLQRVISWLGTTDLVEVSYHEKGRGFSLSTWGAAAATPPAAAGRFTPVCAPAVGIFQWSELGRARKTEEGASVAAGDALGIVETAPGKCVAAAAPCAGRIARILIEAGSAVEYGQPLFFLEACG